MIKDLPDHLTYQTLGYHIHTNRELGMMLRGTKPLAMFSDRPGNFPDIVERYIGMFDRHVRRDLREAHVISRSDGMSEREIQLTLFALPEEAVIELRAFLGAWTDEYERRMGCLLGYEDWQNDVWMERLRARRAEGGPHW